MEKTSVFENIKEVFRIMARGALKADRSPAEIQLIAVTKTVGTAAICEAIESGLRQFGENRVQEAKKKILSGELQARPEKLEWHLIGHLQKNKARDAVRLFDLIQTVDSVGLAEELDRQAALQGKEQRILIQVKLGDEETKSGAAEELLPELLSAVAALPHLRLEGFMAIPPYTEEAADAAPWFSRLRTLRDSFAARGYRLPVLSIGMSHDFETAIMEGSTMVRVGTAIFGGRS